MRYTGVAIALHWLIAALIVAQIAFGWYLQSVPRKTPDRTIYVNLHKSTGLTIGLLILLRLAWRFTHKAPPLPASIPAWQRTAARTEVAGEWFGGHSERREREFRRPAHTRDTAARPISETGVPRARVRRNDQSSTSRRAPVAR